MKQLPPKTLECLCLYRLFVVVSLTAFQSCSLLTKSEVQEVKTFAAATKAYGTMPGGAIKACGDIIRYDSEIRNSGKIITDAKAANETLKDLDVGRTQQQQFAAAAAKADKALDVLNTYADCLSALSSDTYTDQLGQSAADLGKSLDNAVATYDKTFNSKVGSFGAIVAGIVRGGGGLYIRHEQIKYLREFISTADVKLIPAITRDVEAVMQNKVRPELEHLKTALDQDFVHAVEPQPTGSNQTAQQQSQVAKTEPLRVPIATLQTIDSWHDDIDNVEKLTDSAATSAKTYRMAHAKLAAAFTKQASLADAEEEVQTLISEVKAGQQTYQQLKK